MKIKFFSRQKNISSIINKLNTTVLVISLSTCTVTSLLFIYASTVNIMTSTLKEEAMTGAKRIEWVIKSYKNIAQGMGSIPELSNPHISTKTKEMILANKANEYKLIRCKIINKDGYSDMDTQYRGDRDYFKEAIKGNVCVSDPLISRTDGQKSLIIGAPVWKNGIYNGRIDSVLFCSIDINILNNILQEFNISKNCNIYLLGKEGKTVASLYKDGTQGSNSRSAKENKTFPKVTDFERRSLEDTRNSSHIFKYGVLHCYSSHLIEGTPGWAVIIDAPVTDFLGTFWVALGLIITICTIVVLFSRFYIGKHSRIISEPVEHMAERLRQAAVGDFKSEVSFEDSVEEIKIISNATQSLINRMDNVLNGINSEFATSNLSTFINFEDYAPYVERFEKEMNVYLCLFDNRMEKLIGSINNDSTKTESAPILINNKFVGKFVISPKEECPFTPEALKKFIENFSSFIGRVIESILSREIHYKARQKNDLINNEKMLQTSEAMAKELLTWSKKIKDLGGNADIKKASEFFEKEAIDFHSNILENAEFSRFTNFNYSLHEKDYELSYLLENIEIRATRDAIKKENIAVNAKEKPEETLFGDREAIEKAVSRIIHFLELKNPECAITTIASIKKNTFGYTLQFKFIIDGYRFTTHEIEKLRKIEAAQKKFSGEINDDEMKLLSAYNLIWLMDGTIKTISTDDFYYELLLEIPQL
ncbi:cache domain-containing protein [Treponema sp.]|uniref:cache domain-containing protein n=1 Tax=Treponema sp. TaxID=166 RepID=UPI00388D826F